MITLWNGRKWSPAARLSPAIAAAAATMIAVVLPGTTGGDAIDDERVDLGRTRTEK
jgi:hypothetical protein